MKKIIAFLLTVLILTALLCSCGNKTREITHTRINDKGELVVLYSDGVEQTVGTVVGRDGKDGVDGENGRDGLDGKDGADGKNGLNGKDGINGEEGPIGSTGKRGVSIDKARIDENGRLVLEYDDGTSDSIDLSGKLYLFGGECGANVSWALYNGGHLVISGSGATNEYEEGKAPWSPLIPMITSVYVDTASGVIPSENLLFGISDEIITYPTIDKLWVDMTVEAPIYAAPNSSGGSIAMLPLGSELQGVGLVDGFVKIEYNGGFAYIEAKYTVSNNGSVVYDSSDVTLTVIREGGANLRTFPDATSASNNTYGNVPKGTELTCTGISKNGNWYRVSYEGKTLYAWNTWVSQK